MAITPIQFIVSSSATAVSGSNTIAVSGNVDCSSIKGGVAVQVGNSHFVEGVAGTVPDGSGISTITLRHNWFGADVTSRLVAFNSYEGLSEAIRRAREIVENTSQIEELTGSGYLYKNEDGSYSSIPESSVAGSMRERIPHITSGGSGTTYEYARWELERGVVGHISQFYDVVIEVKTLVNYETCVITIPVTTHQLSNIKIDEGDDDKIYLELMPQNGMDRMRTQMSALAGGNFGSQNRTYVYWSDMTGGNGSVEIASLTGRRIPNRFLTDFQKQWGQPIIKVYYYYDADYFRVFLGAVGNYGGGVEIDVYSTHIAIDPQGGAATVGDSCIIEGMSSEGQPDGIVTPVYYDSGELRVSVSSAWYDWFTAWYSPTYTGSTYSYWKSDDKDLTFMAFDDTNIANNGR